MRTLFSRLWAHRNLRKGQCDWCRAILPDDNETGFCDSKCAAAFDEAFDEGETPII